MNTANDSSRRKLGGRGATEAHIDGAVGISVGKSERPLPEGWTWQLLTDLARLESGHTPSRRHPEYWGGTIPWIGIRDATANHGRTINVTNEYTNEIGIANSAARVLPKDTVCLSRTASVGYVVVMGVPMATSQDFVNWVCSEKLDYRYLKYALIAEGKGLLKFASGSVHQTIYFPEVKSFYIAAPQIDKQREIADTLSALDDKIENNRQFCETLYVAGREIFKDWFVDFGPIRRKDAGLKNAIEVMGGITTDPQFAAVLARSFPQKIGGNGVPEGWLTKTIGDLSEVVGGSTPSTSVDEYWVEGTHRWATPKDLSGFEHIFLDETERRVTQSGLKKISSGLLPVGTVLLSSRAPIGYLAIAQNPMAINQGFIALRPTAEMPTAYAFYWCRENMDLIKASANGSTFQEISKGNFRSLEVVSPDKEVMSRYVAVVQPILAAIEEASNNSRSLAAMRDFLLPKLICGAVGVKGLNASTDIGDV